MIIVSVIVGQSTNPTAWCTHEYTVIEQQDATCTKSGQIKKICSRCNNEVVEIVEPYHLWIEDSVTEATCINPKQITKKCSVCGITEYEKIGDLLNHSWVEDSVTEATCINPKQITKKCSVCGITEMMDEGSTIPHSFGDWSISIDPTADKEGQQTRKCTVCKYIESASIPKITYIEVTVNDLWNAFNENEIAAEQKYSNKTVRVTGVISNINSGGILTSANVLLTVDNTFWGCVQCNFNSENAKALANLHKGESVTIEGTCGKISIYNLMISACKVIE